MTKKPLTVGRIAKACHVAHRSVLTWIDDGKLQSYTTPGGHNRIQINDLLDFLKRFNMPIPDEFNAMTQSKRILIVDDDRDIVASLKRVFAVDGLNDIYEVDIAYDGFDAGGKILTFRPDLVLLDIRMPGMDGYEVARRIKETPEGAHTNIIAMSAYFAEEGKEKILSCGADACLDKPIHPDLLLLKIKEIFS